MQTVGTSLASRVLRICAWAASGARSTPSPARTPVARPAPDAWRTSRPVRPPMPRLLLDDQRPVGSAAPASALPRREGMARSVPETPRGRRQDVSERAGNQLLWRQDGGWPGDPGGRLALCNGPPAKWPKTKRSETRGAPRSAFRLNGRRPARTGPAPAPHFSRGASTGEGGAVILAGRSP